MHGNTKTKYFTRNFKWTLLCKVSETFFFARCQPLSFIYYLCGCQPFVIADTCVKNSLYFPSIYVLEYIYITFIYNVVYLNILLRTIRAGLSGDRNPVEGEISRTCPDRPWGPPSLLYNG